MKKSLVVLALTLFAVTMITGMSFADCPGGDCPDPVVTTNTECDGNCDGAFVDGWNEGNLWGDTDITDNTIWGVGCSSLAIGTVAGASDIGTASIDNISYQVMDLNVERPDGTAGLRIQDVTTASLSTTATDGAFEGGRIFSENHAGADLYSNIMDTGLDAGMNSHLSMAEMVCATPGTTGTLDSQMLNSSFQTTEGNGISTIQQNEMLGTLKIEVN